MRAMTMVLAAAAAVFMGTAADEGGFRHWAASQLKDEETKLAAKDPKGAFETLADFGTHNLMMAVRHGNGVAELHEKMADVFVVRSGTATLVVGGEMVDGKTTAPGEIRGTSVRGGKRQELAAGDVVHIPAGAPHQILMKAGDTFSYFVVKARETP
jgi:mannose-6-phosphate isomerase-like protein (cupin superfamily)